MDGPMAAQGALDSVIQGRAGWMSITGEPGAPPTRTGLSLVDYAAGYVAAIAMLGALMRARRDGVGCDCDVSLHETALSLLTYFGTWTASRGFVPERKANSAHPSVVPFQNFETADGWIVIACPKQELWLRLCDAIGRRDLPGRPEYADLTARAANREPLIETLGETLRTKTTAEWLEIFAPAGVPSGPVNDIPTALVDPHVLAREGIESYEHEVLGTVRSVRSPLRLTGPRWRPSRAPHRGEHTDDVLRESGFEPGEIAAFADAGAFGSSRRKVVEES
jgi:crotonobetainyl-CoA:carnitine CoA-transferase CaiB-like acyl-CoA transferase